MLFFVITYTDYQKCQSLFCKPNVSATNLTMQNTGHF